jgi:uncharacterized membrane protein
MPLAYAIIKNIFVNTASRFFTEEEQLLIEDAIRAAEKNTSGEIRVHLESICWGDPIKRAQKIFHKLGIDNTKEQNGILIYIATENHKIAVIGDAGIHKKLGTEYWDKIVQELISKFRAGKEAEALATAIIDCGEQLKHYFPYLADDKNELNDSISFKG